MLEAKLVSHARREIEGGTLLQMIGIEALHFRETNSLMLI
jgi:hypothetical protein